MVASANLDRRQPDDQVDLGRRERCGAKVTVDDFLLSSAPASFDADLTTFLADASANPLPIALGGTGTTSGANVLVALAALPLAGGTMTGNIIRSGKGCHVYFSDAAMTTPKIFITAAATADPRAGVPGEIWLKY
jgi:hypothetical protein